MARTKTADYDEKRLIIMKTAAQLFAENSFNGSSVAQLAKACGISKSLIYHYYNSKEEILFDVANNYMDKLLAVINDPAHERANPQEELRVLTKVILESYSDVGDEQKVILFEMKSLKPSQRKKIIKKERLVVERVENLFKQILPRSKNQKSLVSVKTMLYFGMLNWTHNWFDPKGPLSRDELATEAVSLFLK